MNESTLKKLRQMKLLGMANVLETSLANTQRENLSCDEFLSVLVDAEYDDRTNRRIERNIRNARFRYKASMEELYQDIERNINRTLLTRLATCTFIDKAENILITGSTGIGKSYIASAFGNQACIQGYKVMYSNTKRLFTRLKLSKADGSYLKELSRIEKTDLLILDDFGLQEIDAFGRNVLMEIIEDRHGKKSIIIVSQLPITLWYEILGEETVADAIMDRIVHNAYRFELQGESLRKRKRISEKEPVLIKSRND
jgi:DNA replication protein DnaC